MARAAKTNLAPAKPASQARKTASRATSPTKKAAAVPVSKKTKGTSKPGRHSPAPIRKIQAAPAAAVPAPKLSKDELRAMVDKLERSNATLRAKSRDTNRDTKTANNRIAELEAEIARLQEQATRTQAAVKPVKAAKAPRAVRASRKAMIDPGDAVPPGVAVEEPQPLDEEAQAARDALEEHLSAG